MTFPRRLTPSDKERATIVQQRMTPGGALGVGSRHVRSGNTPARGGQSSGAGIVVVEHGDDPTVDRPIAAVVRWVGAATPNNALDYDDWYPADVVG